MPRSQTPTPKQRAQDAVDKADAALAKKREKLAKLAERAQKAKAAFDSARTEHAALQTVIAYDARHRDLLASHPLLAGDQIPGQTSIADFAQDEDPAEAIGDVAEEAAAEAEAEQDAMDAGIAQIDAQVQAEQDAEDRAVEQVAEAKRPGGITVRENTSRPAGKRLFSAAPTSDEEGVTPVPEEEPEDVFQVPAEDEKPADADAPFVL